MDQRRKRWASIKTALAKGLRVCWDGQTKSVVQYLRTHSNELNSCTIYMWWLQDYSATPKDSSCLCFKWAVTAFAQQKTQRMSIRSRFDLKIDSHAPSSDNTIHWPNVGSMLGQRRRRWPNIELTLGADWYSSWWQRGWCGWPLFCRHNSTTF